MSALIPGPWYIAWKSEPEKVPYLGTDKKANVWTDGPYLEHGAAAALAASDGFAGVGVVFSASHRLGGVDIDAGRDPATGEATPWAAAIIAGLGGGAVPSPSGTGWRVWVLTDKDPRGPRKRKWTDPSWRAPAGVTYTIVGTGELHGHEPLGAAEVSEGAVLPPRELADQSWRRTHVERAHPFGELAHLLRVLVHRPVHITPATTDAARLTIAEGAGQ